MGLFPSCSLLGAAREVHFVSPILQMGTLRVEEEPPLAYRDTIHQPPNLALGHDVPLPFALELRPEFQAQLCP